MKFRKWEISTSRQEDVSALCDAGYPWLLSKVLAARGITGPDEAEALLVRQDRLTLSPMLMRDMDKAAARIRQAIADRETVVVFGDYDADGITSTVLLTDFLRRSGLRCLRYIPRRIEEGYGLSCEAIDGLHAQGATLMITVDCGITGSEEVTHANALGMDVIVTDHHECQGPMPQAVAVVDPHRPDCPYPFKYLAGVGVALKLALALTPEDRHEEVFARYCPLAAIGTVADVMRMEGENRIIVRRGLEVLERGRTGNPVSANLVGISALAAEAGLTGKTISAGCIGFALAPRINAAGRMDRADLAANLLETVDPALAQELAEELCFKNQLRQQVERSIFDEAEVQIQSLAPEERHALVLGSENWHQGVVGIVASRLSEKYTCPSFVIDIKEGRGKGSCRSYGGFNLFAALEDCADLLEGFGGHELAAGFTILEENIPAFRTKMNRCVQSAYGGKQPETVLHIDAEVSCPDKQMAECPGGWSQRLLDEVTLLDQQLEPYGAGNPQPVFCLQGAYLDSIQPVGQGKHLKLRLSKGCTCFDAIFFSATEEECGLARGSRVDAAFRLQPNTFKGCTRLQLQILDLRSSLTPSRSECCALNLVRRLAAGETVTSREASRLWMARERFGSYWRVLCHYIGTSRETVDTLPFLRLLAEQVGGGEAFLRAALALTVFQERGLLSMEQAGEQLHLRVLPIDGKVDLFRCPYLARIGAGPVNEN